MTALTRSRSGGRSVLVAAALAALTITAIAATLPAGFSETVVASGLANPTAMAFAPDGRLFVCQQGGQLRVIQNGTLLVSPFLSVTVSSAGERGLLGVAFDPNFVSNNFVYVYYTATTPTVHNRVSRFTANGNVAVAGSETVILDLNPLSSATNHNGGAMHFGLDGKLYIAVGDNANSANSQSFGNLLGKILRINADGSVPADNPFLSQATGVNGAIWAIGLRNPFTFSIHPLSGRMLINDVGEQTWEEINEGIAGANYGWPATEGPTTDPRFVPPLYAYRHGNGPMVGCAITGGVFHSGAGDFPAEFDGDYFFGDFCSGWINRFDDSSGLDVSTFASGIAAPVDLALGPDGELYYLARGGGSNTGTVTRIAFAESDAPDITVHPANQSVSVGQPATFSVQATGSAPLSYQWQRNGQNIGGATSSSYTITAVSANDNGAAFRCAVSNAVGSVVSNTALLTTTTPSGGANVALASAGAVVSASSTYAAGFSASSLIDGERSGVNWGNGGGWADGTPGSFPDFVQVDFAASHSIGRVDVFTVQDTFWAPSEPTSTQTFTAYGVRNFEVQYWTGTAWATVPGSSVTGNTQVWRTVTFVPVTTQKIRVVTTASVDGYSRLTEVEAYTADGTPPPPSGGANVALASAGAVVSASSTYAAGFSASSLIDGERSGVNWGNGGGWADGTPGSFPDFVQVDFAASHSIGRVDVFTVQDTFWAPSEPTSTQTFTAYGVRNFEVQYWTGTAWATVPGSSVTGNTQVWRTVTFVPVTTQKIRVVTTASVDGYSRLTEVEAYTADGTPPPPSGGANVALASAGAVVSASSTYAAGFSASSLIDGERSGVNWGNGGGWADGTPGSFPDFVQVDFAASHSIGRVDVFTVQDTFWAPSEPTSTQTFTAYGVRNFEVQYWTGTAWATVPGSSVTGNTQVWRTVTFVPVTTQKIRVVTTASVDGYSRLTEVEAYSSGGAPPSQPTFETYTVVNQYPHDPAAFTQGLELAGGSLYESTGLNGSSSLRQVDRATGVVLRRVDVPAQHFAEGMTLFQGKIFQLTWQSHIGFIYDAATFNQIGQFSYSGEGWGLTHDSQFLVMSDGTEQIRFIDPNTFQTVRVISVFDGQSSPVTRINELEYVNGQIYANIWQTDYVIRIDPANGRILGWIDLRGLLPTGTSADVLNGIAYDAGSGHLLVTGKLWPTLFEITLRPVSQ